MMKRKKHVLFRIPLLFFGLAIAAGSQSAASDGCVNRSNLRYSCDGLLMTANKSTMTMLVVLFFVGTFILHMLMRGIWQSSRELQGTTENVERPYMTVRPSISTISTSSFNEVKQRDDFCKMHSVPNSMSR
ncbi:unnamed protein product [Dibothriocephalus latus]|uniref:Frizzled/Smoothened transmembrane domain-containing protein n=1 Tax=Dibothriocephalus latus TaxID=60516 RepID=A0A3P7NZ82_DIBLA|nr:unnamed protein product [Dibothriocephalus latus]